MTTLECIERFLENGDFPEVSLVVNFLTKNGVKKEMIEDFKKSYSDITKSHMVRSSLRGTPFLTALAVALNSKVLEFFLYSLQVTLEKEKEDNMLWEEWLEESEQLEEKGVN